MTDHTDTVPEADKVQEIIALIESGESERGACERVGMNRMTFRSRALKLGAADQYARAISALADAQTEALEVAIEDMRSGKIDAAMARVEIDARKWFASKFLPKRYGDKIAHVGGDPASGDQPVRVAVDVSGMSAATLAELAGLKVEGE
jgi:hypothetical protein